MPTAIVLVLASLLMVSVAPAASAGAVATASGEEATPSVTVFELPNSRARVGKDGRLAVWMRCSVPGCAVTVQIRAVSDAGRQIIRFSPRQAPVRRAVVGTTAKLVRLPLSAAQRRGLRRIKGPVADVAAAVTASAPGGRSKLLTDGLSCRRADPCGNSSPGGRRPGGGR